MVSVDEKSSNHESDVKGPNDSLVLDRNRRAALAEVDNAKFSLVSLGFLLSPCKLEFC